jgi:two-component system, OmpR family, alkaline phosphatase synthesis response regulator PhoP
METEKFKVLIIDDDPSIHEFLTYNLKKADFKVFSAKNGIEGVSLAKETVPDIILLDVMLPEMDGVMACIELRKEPKLNSTLIIFLSARGEDYSQIAGYEAGGNDYITKPVSPRVLIAKLKAILHKTIPEKREVKQEENILKRGKLLIDREKFKVVINNKEIILPRKEFELLYMLASKPDKVFTRNEIFNKIWGDDSESGYRTIDVHVRKIREKLGENFLITQKGVGYKFQD